MELNTGEEANWKTLIKDMRKAIWPELIICGRSFKLAPVQSVTLRVTLEYLFGVPEEDLDDNRDGLIFMADRINTLWQLSKDAEAKSIPAWQDEKLMHKYLEKLIDCDALKPRENPMNFILPAYETMWRAVFRGFIEVYCRQADHAANWKKTLREFLSNPIERVWQKEYQPTELSARDIVKEILRLYPPTRRIYRQYEDPDMISADVESLHRNSLLAPNDPDTFRPERWLEIKAKFERVKYAYAKRKGKTVDNVTLRDFEKDRGYMPFAETCPAGSAQTDEFGFKMIALLVASLVEAFDRLNGRWEVQAGGDVKDGLPPLGEALKSGRGDYLTLVYKRMFHE